MAWVMVMAEGAAAEAAIAHDQTVMATSTEGAAAADHQTVHDGSSNSASYSRGSRSSDST